MRFGGWGWGWGWGVNRHTYRYVLILPAKRVFLFFGVKASLRYDGVSPLTYYFSQQIHCSNGAFSFSNETSPDEFLSRPICAIALCIHTVHRFTQKVHARILEQNISCFFFLQPVRKTVIAT